ncbi:MAG: S-layer homology domain-containing protein [Ignavibacteriales bacterium]
MKRAVAGTLAVCIIVSLGLAAVFPCAAEVSDMIPPLRGIVVSNSHWSQVYVEALSARGCLDGIPGLLDMDARISRAVFTHLLLRTLGLESSSNEASRLSPVFGDVEPGYWAASAAGIAYEKGWVRGYGMGTFRPESSLTRAEAAVILYRALRPAVGGSVDLTAWGESVPEWATEGVSAALAHGWLEGDTDGGLRLDSPVKVSEACAMIWRALEITGGQYDISGTVSGVGPERGSVTIDELNGETVTVVLNGAVTFRNGVRCQPGEIRPLDEVFIISGRDGQPVFAEVRYIDDAGFVEEVDPSNRLISYVDRSGVIRRAAVSARTDVRVLGNKARLSAVSKGDRVYVVFDSVNGSVRILDVASMNVSGRIVSVSPDLSAVTARVANAGTRTLRIGTDTVVYVNNALSNAGAVSEKDVFQASLGDDGVLRFLQVFPVGN